MVLAMPWRHLPGVGPAGWQGSQLSLRRGAAEAAGAGACRQLRRLSQGLRGTQNPMENPPFTDHVLQKINENP